MFICLWINCWHPPAGGWQKFTGGGKKFVSLRSLSTTPLTKTLKPPLESNLFDRVIKIGRRQKKIKKNGQISTKYYQIQKCFLLKSLRIKTRKEIGFLLFVHEMLCLLHCKKKWRQSNLSPAANIGIKSGSIQGRGSRACQQQ